LQPENAPPENEWATAVAKYRDDIYKLSSICVRHPSELKLPPTLTNHFDKIAHFEKYMEGDQERVRIIRILTNHSNEGNNTKPRGSG